MWAAGASNGFALPGGGGTGGPGPLPPPPRQAPCAVEVHGLDAGASLAQIRQLFQQLAPVAAIHAAVDGDAPQAAAIVAFHSPAAAAQAVELVDGYPLGNSFLHVKLAGGLAHHFIASLSSLDPSFALASQQAAARRQAAETEASRQQQQQPPWQQQPYTNGGAHLGNGATNGVHAASLEQELRQLHLLQQREHEAAAPVAAQWQQPGTASRSGSSWASLGGLSSDAGVGSSGAPPSASASTPPPVGAGGGAPAGAPPPHGAGAAAPSSGRLMVRNLQLKTTSAQIRELFTPYGPVDECMKFPDARYAFVHFHAPASAAAAAAALDGREVAGVSDEGGMRVEFREAGGGGASAAPAGGAAAEAAAGAAPAAGGGGRRSGGSGGSAAAAAGPPISAATVVATAARKVAMLAAKEAAAPEPLWGRPPKPGGQDGASHEPTTKLWLGAIDGAANPVVVKKVFSRYGTVYDIELQRATHEKGRSDQWGFVNFRRVEDASKAFEALVGEVIPELTGHRKLKLQFRVPSGRKDGGRR